MSKNIAAAFGKGKAFIPFITCGDPSLDVTEQLVYAMEEAGADLIELGNPIFRPYRRGACDPGSQCKSIGGGVTTDKIFDMVVRIREKTRHSYGIYDLRKCGVFLWNGELYPKSGGNRNGRSDPSGCAF